MSKHWNAGKFAATDGVVWTLSEGVRESNGSTDSVSAVLS